jgi:hypothetical protein
MIEHINTIEDARREFKKIQNSVDLSQWSEYLFDSGLLGENDQVDGIAPWDVPESADKVWDNGENVLIQFGDGDFCLWVNSDRDWDIEVSDDENPMYKDLATAIEDASVEVEDIDSNDNFRSNGWVNTTLKLNDGTTIGAGFWYKTPFRDSEPSVAADDSPRETRAMGGGWEGDSDIDLHPYGSMELGTISLGEGVYTEDHIKTVWDDFSVQYTGQEEAYDALIEKIRDSLMKELEKTENWYELEDFLPKDDE